MADTPHAAYVQAGYCPYIWQKTWCNDRVGHFGPHWATRRNPDLTERRVDLPSARSSLAATGGDPE